MLFFNGEVATPENYLGDWVPEHRRRLLSQIGFGNGAGLELLSLRKQYNAEKNNYAKQDIMSKIVNAETRFNRELQGQEQEYRSLARDANYAGARKMVNEETAGGRSEGLAARVGNAILSNNHFSHGVINHGRLVAPAGNAVEDALKAYELTGRTPSLDLLQMLAVSDALTQDDYMPSGPFGIKKSIGGYKSMGIAGGSYTGNTDAFAYGGDGSQYARQEAQNILRDYNWANDAAKSYQNSMNNKNPLGTFKGGEVQRGPGLPGIDANGWIPDWMGDGKYSPDQLSKALGSYDKSQGYYSKRGVTQVGDPTKASGRGSGQVAGAGYDPYDYGAMVPSYSGPDPNGWIDGYSTGSRNPQRFDPTVASDEYTPQLGNGAGYRQERNSNPYFDLNGRQISGLQGAGRSYSMPAYPAAMGIADVKPNIQKSAKPFGGTLSPEWTSNDQFTAPLFSSRGSGVQNNYAVPSSASASSFDRYAMGPMEVGALYASAPFASSPAPRSIQPFSRLNR